MVEVISPMMPTLYLHGALGMTWMLTPDDSGCYPCLPWQRQICQEQRLQDLIGCHICLAGNYWCISWFVDVFCFTFNKTYHPDWMIPYDTYIYIHMIRASVRICEALTVSCNCIPIVLRWGQCKYPPFAPHIFRLGKFMAELRWAKLPAPPRHLESQLSS